MGALVKLHVVVLGMRGVGKFPVLVSGVGLAMLPEDETGGGLAKLPVVEPRNWGLAKLPE